MRELSADELTELRSRIAAVPYWYHKIPLPDGIVTPGWAPLNVDAYRVPADLTGKRILDVGAWDGFWTFKAFRRGTGRLSPSMTSQTYAATFPNRRAAPGTTLIFAATALGYDDHRCQRINMTVYEVKPEQTGMFDIVFFFGTIYHLRHPLLALDQLSAVCTEQIFVESAVCDDYSPYRGGFGHGYPGGQIVAEFYPDDEYGGNETNWWVPTVHCLAGMVRAAGFDEVEGWKLTEQPRKLPAGAGLHWAERPVQPTRRKSYDAPASVGNSIVRSSMRLTRSG